MKINSGDTHTYVTPGVDQLTFRVEEEDQGFIFEMLRNKIYSDAIAAICREIASNSRDANREVLKGHVPIEIGFKEEHPLNGDSSLHVYFKDEGPGISPDRMSNVYCKYAKSTKRDDNYQTGGFGLGAKTPFAYADAFTIITNVDCVEYTYTAYIDESKRGMIAKLNEAVTSAPNGTTIMIPITPRDRQKFEFEIIKYTAYWEVQPKLVGFQNKSYEHDTHEARYGIVVPSNRKIMVYKQGQVRHFTSSHMFVVDGIPYECDITKLDQYSDKNYTNFNNSIIAVCINTGDVDLSVNRETLNYTELTLSVMSEVMEEIHAYACSVINTMAADCASYFEACALAASIINSRYSNFKMNDMAVNAISWLNMFAERNAIEKMLNYQGRVLKTESVNLSHLNFVVAYINDNDNVAYRKIDFNLLFFYKRDVFVLDTPMKSMERTRIIINEPCRERKFILVSDGVYKPKHRISMNAQDLATGEAKFKEGVAKDRASFDLYEIPMRKYSDVSLAPKVKTVTGKREIIEVSVREYNPNNGRKFSDYFIKDEVRILRGSGPIDDDDQDMSHRILYIVAQDMSKIDTIKGDDLVIARYMKYAYGLTVCIVPKRLAHHFKNCLDIETATNTIDTKRLQRLVNADSIVNLSAQIESFGILSINFDDAALKKQMLEVKENARRYKKLRSLDKLNNFGTLDTVAVKHGIVPNQKSLDGIRKYLNDFKKIYPLTSNVSLSYCDNSTRKHIEQYIMLINKYTKSQTKKV